MLLAASFTTLLLAARERTFVLSKQRQLLSILKVVGAVTLVLVLLYTLFDSLRRRCDDTEYLCGFIPWFRTPPAPPPPLPPMAKLQIASIKSANQITRFCKEHPYTVMGAAGSIFLFDLFNVAVTIDRLDPIVSLVTLISRPIGRAARWVWRIAAQRRAQTLVVAAAKAQLTVR